MARETTLVDLADTLRAMADDIIALDARADAMEEALSLANAFLLSIEGHGYGGTSAYDVAAHAVRAALDYAPLRAPRAPRPDEVDLPSIDDMRGILRADNT